RDQSTPVHDSPLVTLRDSVRPEGANRTFLMSQNRTLLKSPHISKFEFLLIIYIMSNAVFVEDSHHGTPTMPNHDSELSKARVSVVPQSTPGCWTIQ
ncbi:hypothetical protein VSR82_35155, partial [Burkholderia sp. JPY481]